MKNFEELYQELQNTGKQELEEVWKKSKEEKKKANKISIIVCLIIDLIIIAFVISGGGLSGFPFGIMFILPILVFNVIISLIITAIFSKNQNKYTEKYKSIIINKMIENFYDSLEYFPNKQMPSRIYDEVGYNESYNRYYSDDYFEAKINNKYDIGMAEVTTKKVETRTDSKGRTHTTTYLRFSGLFAKIVIDKSINSEVSIRKNGALSFSKNKLEMDSGEFEKYFDVSASDKIKGMQLLTADVMEELIEFENKTNIQYEITIRDNYIYLRFHSGTMFEPKQNKNEVLDKKSIQSYFYMLNFTYNLSNKLINLIHETEF